MQGMVDCFNGLYGDEFVVLASIPGKRRASRVVEMVAEAARRGIKPVLYTMELSEKVFWRKIDEYLGVQDRKSEITIIDGCGMSPEDIIHDMREKIGMSLFVIDYFSLFVSEKNTHERLRVCAELKAMMKQKKAILVCSQGLHRDVTDSSDNEAVLNSLFRRGIDVTMIDRVLLNNEYNEEGLIIVK